MDFDFSITENPVSTMAVALKTVYTVNADTSYDVRKFLKDNKDWVALRTTGGEGCVKLAGMDEITVLPGTLLFFEHRLVRRYYCRSQLWSFWWFEFSSAGPVSLPAGKLIQLDYAGDEEEDACSCLELLRKSDTSSRLLASSAFSNILFKWAACFGKNSDANPYQAAVEHAIDQMRSCIPDNVSVRDLAQQAGLCERRFRDVFKQVTGMQPKKYFDAMRAGMAAELLRNTTLSIAEISEKLGYSSQFHFTGSFKKIYKLAPSQFRKYNIF